MKLAQDEFHQSLYLFIDCQCIGYPLLLTTYTYHEHQCHHDEFLNRSKIQIRLVPPC